MKPPILTVVIEYIMSQSRVAVRGVFVSPAKHLPKLHEENQQNYIDCFLDVDNKLTVGFAKLVPEEDLIEARAEIARLQALLNPE